MDSRRVADFLGFNYIRQNIEKHKMAPIYQQSKIYAIRSPQTDNIYIGSTTQSLCARMAQHRGKYKFNRDGTSSKEILKYGDAYIELVELFTCNNVEELHKREYEIIRQHPTCINKRCPIGIFTSDAQKRAQQKFNENNEGFGAAKSREWRLKRKEENKIEGQKIDPSIPALSPTVI